MTKPAVVIGCSAGGAEALRRLLGELRPGFDFPILVVQHLHDSDRGMFAENLAAATGHAVREPCDKEPLRGGCIYIAPATYHMLAERSGRISLSVDPAVRWSRPSIDVLFESAARAWGHLLVAAVLTGANSDGSRGVQAVKHGGGVTVAEDPESAEFPVMPAAAIATGCIDHVMTADAIGAWLGRHSFTSEGAATRGVGT